MLRSCWIISSLKSCKMRPACTIVQAGFYIIYKQIEKLQIVQGSEKRGEAIAKTIRIWYDRSKI